MLLNCHVSNACACAAPDGAHSKLVWRGPVLVYRNRKEFRVPIHEVRKTIRHTPTRTFAAAVLAAGRQNSRRCEMRVLAILVVLPVAVVLTGMVADSYILFTAPSVASAEYGHAFGVHSKGMTERKIVYLSERQAELHATFDSMQNYGLAGCLGVVALIWLGQRFDKGRGAMRGKDAE
jgi:hypothetical protein